MRLALPLHLIEAAELAAALAAPRTAQPVVIDCRHDLSRPEWGRQEFAAGHIPGASNYFFKRNVDSRGLFLTPEALRESFDAALGHVPPEQIVCYCGSGVSACHNLLALEHAGLHGAKLYPGSWSEWSSDPSRPVEIGDASTDEHK